jgi:hypothetical protein
MATSRLPPVGPVGASVKPAGCERGGRSGACTLGRGPASAGEYAERGRYRSGASRESTWSTFRRRGERVMADAFYCGAYWPARAETVADCAARLARFLGKAESAELGQRLGNARDYLRLYDRDEDRSMWLGEHDTAGGAWARSSCSQMGWPRAAMMPARRSTRRGCCGPAVHIAEFSPNARQDTRARPGSSPSHVLVGDPDDREVQVGEIDSDGTWVCGIRAGGRVLAVGHVLVAWRGQPACSNAEHVGCPHVRGCLPQSGPGQESPQPRAGSAEAQVQGVLAEQRIDVRCEPHVRCSRRERQGEVAYHFAQGHVVASSGRADPGIGRCHVVIRRAERTGHAKRDPGPPRNAFAAGFSGLAPARRRRRGRRR